MQSQTSLQASYPAFPISKVSREIEIETEDGLILHGWQLEARAPHIGNVLIVHGFKDYSERYLHFAHVLSDAGYQVFGYDQRGHARSGGDRVFFPEFELVVRDLESALFTFKKFDDGRPWIIMGHSVGASVVARYVTTHTQGYEGFILSAPPLERMPSINKFVEGSLKVINIFAPHLPVVDLPNKNFSRDPAVVASMETDPMMSNIKIPARSGLEALGNMDFVMENLSNVHLPFLALHGTVDNINNIEGTKAFYVGTPSIKGKKIKIYEGLSHDLLHEPEFEMVEADILNWINSIIKKGRD